MIILRAKIHYFFEISLAFTGSVQQIPPPVAGGGEGEIWWWVKGVIL